MNPAIETTHSATHAHVLCCIQEGVQERHCESDADDINESDRACVDEHSRQASVFLYQQVDHDAARENQGKYDGQQPENAAWR